MFVTASPLLPCCVCNCVTVATLLCLGEEVADASSAVVAEALPEERFLAAASSSPGGSTATPPTGRCGGGGGRCERKWRGVIVNREDHNYTV